MNAIIGMTSIGKSASDVEKKDYAFDKIEGASNHLLGVINDILDMSKIEANKFDLSYEEFEFEKMLNKVVVVVVFRVEERYQVLRVKHDPHIPQRLIGDDQRLTQVITNLLSNAMKFTPEKGVISIYTHLLKREDDLYTIQIEVKDTGIGISKENQKRLFDSFEQAESNTTRKYGGTGLGLSISRRIVELMGGEIWVESHLGNGATFAFTVPMKRGSIESSALLPSINKEDVRLLVVDDDPETLEYFSLLTKRMGIACDAAGSGQEALELLSRGNQYSICFVDWKMPEMDGIKLTREMKNSIDDKSVVIMISANDWSTIKQEAKSVGVDGFLYKPLFPSSLIDIINSHIGIIVDSDLSVSPEQMDIFSGHYILLAEDVEINREIAIALLEPSQLGIDCAENGVEAVRMFREAPDKYSMILMDIQMPEMDGYDATKSIRAIDLEQAKNIPIIAMTANVFKEDIEKCLAVGMNDHLGKPININEVLGKLREYLLPQSGLRPQPNA
jgi:CheY-like chemotaxis protein